MKLFYQVLSGICLALFFSTFADAQEYRMLDGRFNNPGNPGWGAVDAHMLQPGTDAFADGYAAPAGADRPNPRHISNLIFNQSALDDDPRGLSAYAWAWGQFIDHDITLVPDHPTEAMPIAVPPFDYFFDPNGTGTVQIDMFRSLYDPSTGTNPGNPRRFFNKISAFIDGSGIYGSDFNRASWLRMYSRGKLKLSDGKLLPFNTVTGEYAAPLDQQAPSMAMPLPFVQKWFIAGDVRANENPFLLAMHTLFAREHNRLCAKLLAENPSWADGELYEEARRRVGALIQAITYEEWLPTLGVHLAPYTGYKPDVNPGIENIFSAAAYRYGHSTINSVLIRMDNAGNYMPQGNVLLRDAFFNPSATTEVGGIEPYLMGMSTVVEQDFDCKVIDDLRNFLFGPPGAGGLDLVALNIQRGRDRGLADYNTVRTDYGLAPRNAFSEITADPLMNMSLQNLYQDVNAIDPWVGMLSEDHMPDALFGPTAMTIISRQFTALRDGDRFYYENDPAFSPEEIAEIKNTRLADIIRRNTTISDMRDLVFMAQPLSSPVHDLFVEKRAVKIYPNPVSDQFNLELESVEEIQTQLQVFDPLGRLVFSENTTLHTGLNRIHLQIPAGLAPGRYTLVLPTTGATFNTSFIKS
ncbi:MAG: T9SS type A sorting domain-containing protein [Lewinellaceae bacterium]|nr:T9SS type A sorting domain-containing protein [Saprospiraceae bacterium]MCB9333215.1 T9SS type A sorting domain-containing protein [Lewinellaceae bacterium]